MDEFYVINIKRRMPINYQNRLTGHQAIGGTARKLDICLEIV